MTASKLEIIVARTRPGRVGPSVARWIESQAAKQGGFDEIEVVDLAEVNLPFMNEPHHPRLGRYTHQHTREWSAKVAEADASLALSDQRGSHLRPTPKAVRPVWPPSPMRGRGDDRLTGTQSVSSLPGSATARTERGVRSPWRPPCPHPPPPQQTSPSPRPIRRPSVMSSATSRPRCAW
ncbi:NAD(P)H-dependent oxidoreductase [Streptomyces sp. NPDC005899]|uniref:NADPH-dependent FMN reductase n=1 Tax=Streptomyces sp. NPDC005899 TaxID=3155716 RepID=UPI0033EA27B4